MMSRRLESQLPKTSDSGKKKVLFDTDNLHESPGVSGAYWTPGKAGLD